MASSSSSTSTNESRQYRKNMGSVISFIRKKRKEVRSKTAFEPPEDFVDFEKINNSDYALSPEKLNFFYPVAKTNMNWGYTSDSMTVASKADVTFLKARFPLKRPGPDYFEDREKEALFDKRFALRFPPIYYISKLIKRERYFNEINLFRTGIQNSSNDLWRR